MCSRTCEEVERSKLNKEMVIFSIFDSDRKYAIRIGSWIFLGEYGTFYYRFELYVKK